MSDLSPAVEELVERFDESARLRLSHRELAVEVCVSAAFVAVVVPLALSADLASGLDLPLMAALVLSYALLMRVRFTIGFGYTAPVQIVLVPMLLLLPAALVPLLVVAGYTLGNLPEYVTRQRHPSRVLLGVGDAWHAVGPALVLVLAGPLEVSLSNWPVYLAALGAQFALDFGWSTLREWLCWDVSPRMQPSLFAWTFLVDGFLACIGLLAALAGRDEPAAALLVLPLAGLLALFAREHKARLDNALQLRQAYVGTTLLLSDWLADADEYTGVHSHDVVSLSLAVADEMALDPAPRRLVEFGALLHDVGKISVPPEIIRKNGPLDEEEWAVIRRHTIEGQRMLDQVGGVLGQVGLVVRSSHERWDAGGYPDGLAGEDIPLESSIISCADAFQAMTTDRPYRRGRPPEEALAELLRHSGTQFRPDVVAVFTQIVEGDLRQRGLQLVAKSRREGLAEAV